MYSKIHLQTVTVSNRNKYARKVALNIIQSAVIATELVKFESVRPGTIHKLKINGGPYGNQRNSSNSLDLDCLFFEGKLDPRFSKSLVNKAQGFPG